MKKITNTISAIILVITTAIVVLLMITRLNGTTPQVFGYQLLRVSSPSMMPELNVGEIILSKKVDDITTVKVDDIITYNGEVGEFAGKSITHQVIVAPYSSNGTYYLQTKGIANSYPDPEISAEQVTGTLVCKLAVLGAVYKFFSTPWGLAIVLGILAILFINEAFALRQLIKENEDDESKTEKTSSKISADDERAEGN